MKKGIILISLLALVLIGTAPCEVILRPASQDVYICLGTANEDVFNKTEMLRCEVNVTDIGGIKVSSYPGVPVIQFDISNLNITDDDIGILVIKAASAKKQGNDSAMVTLLPMSSEWSEDSDFTTILVNVLPVWSIVRKNDMSQTSTDPDEDLIFAFDVSKKLKDAKARGDRISFLMMAVGNSSFSVDFYSRESAQGPYLMVMPYPPAPKANPASGLNQTQTTVQPTSQSDGGKSDLQPPSANPQPPSKNQSALNPPFQQLVKLPNGSRNQPSLQLALEKRPQEIPLGA